MPGAVVGGVMSDRLKYERFLWFHRQVKDGRFPNATALVAEYGVSARTAQRDIEFIRDRLQAPLLYQSRQRGYSYTDQTYELPAAWINETNVLALALAVRLASTVPDAAIKDELCCLIDKVIPLAGRGAGSCLERVGEKISVKNIEYSRVDEHCFRLLIQALFADRSLAITYHSPHSGITSQREIHPLHRRAGLVPRAADQPCSRRQPVAALCGGRLPRGGQKSAEPRPPGASGRARSPARTGPAGDQADGRVVWRVTEKKWSWGTLWGGARLKKNAPSRLFLEV